MELRRNSRRRKRQCVNLRWVFRALNEASEGFLALSVSVIMRYLRTWENVASPSRCFD